MFRQGQGQVDHRHAGLWDLKNKDGVWGDGRGFKPSTGDSFRAKSVKVIDGGRKLEVTGCKSIFCRSATWVRAD